MVVSGSFLNRNNVLVWIDKLTRRHPVPDEFLSLRSLHSSFAGSVPMKLQKSASGSRLSNQDLFLQQQQNPIANSNGWSDVNHRSRTQSPSLHGAVLVNQGNGSVYANGAGITVHQNENGDLGGRGGILMGSVLSNCHLAHSDFLPRHSKRCRAEVPCQPQAVPISVAATPTEVPSHLKRRQCQWKRYPKFFDPRLDVP